MKKTISAILAAAVLGSSMMVAVPAQADPRRDRYIERYYQNNAHDRDYRRWQRERNRWSERDYRRWYESRHRRDRRNNNDGAAAIFGLAAGAILGGALSGAGQGQRPSQGASGAPPAGGHPFGTQGYYNYCSSKYRSFDPDSGTFLGNDRQRHYCQ